jgi:hypothetical protein
MDATGLYYIDGKDLWTIFGVFVEAGSDDLLKYPAKKDSIEHDWMDADGIDVDLTRVYLSEREINLKMAIYATSEDDFWNKYNGFIAQMTQPELRRLQIKEFGMRSFFVYYKECTNYTRLTRVLDGTTTFIACKFNLKLVEPMPKPDDTGDQFLVDEDGRFIVT